MYKKFFEIFFIIYFSIIFNVTKLIKTDAKTNKVLIFNIYFVLI